MHVVVFDAVVRPLLFFFPSREGKPPVSLTFSKPCPSPFDLFLPDFALNVCPPPAFFLRAGVTDLFPQTPPPFSCLAPDEVLPLPHTLDLPPFSMGSTPSLGQQL